MSKGADTYRGRVTEEMEFNITVPANVSYKTELEFLPAEKWVAAQQGQLSCTRARPSTPSAFASLQAPSHGRSAGIGGFLRASRRRVRALRERHNGLALKQPFA